MSEVISYDVGAGPYPYRIDGRRLTEPEAISVLIEYHGDTFASAQRKLHLVSTAAVRDAGTPPVRRKVSSSGAEHFRIQDGEPLPRAQAVRELVQEWRLTPPEATRLLDDAVRAYYKAVYAPSR
ncbi:hypothetical protein ABZ234_31845 [Nocardiopsis sp. NPDC006198]|uniref:hypothetical protein n=1 Tax=Nocardiopsis sp. NPDC006198 TaxID=3154472 RepID=UPI00339E7DA4